MFPKWQIFAIFLPVNVSYVDTALLWCEGRLTIKSEKWKITSYHENASVLHTTLIDLLGSWPARNYTRFYHNFWTYQWRKGVLCIMAIMVYFVRRAAAWREYIFPGFYDNFEYFYISQVNEILIFYRQLLCVHDGENRVEIDPELTKL